VQRLDVSIGQAERHGQERDGESLPVSKFENAKFFEQQFNANVEDQDVGGGLEDGFFLNSTAEQPGGKAHHYNHNGHTQHDHPQLI